MFHDKYFYFNDRLIINLGEYKTFISDNIIFKDKIELDIKHNKIDILTFDDDVQINNIESPLDEIDLNDDINYNITDTIIDKLSLEDTIKIKVYEFDKLIIDI